MMIGCGVKFLSNLDSRASSVCRYKYRESIEQKKKWDCIDDPLSISILFITVDYVVNSAKNIAD